MKKKIIITLSCIVSTMVIASIVVLFIYPGLLRGPKVIVDERTGKSFNVVDGKVQVYLPVKITSYQNGTSLDDYDIEVKYDNKARITEKNVQGHNISNEAYSQRTSFTYDIDGRLKHISDSGQGDDFVDDWNFEYKDDYIKSVSKEEKSKQRDIESYLTSPYIYYEYNSNGLLIDYYSSNSNYNNGEKTQRSLHTIQYDDNGIMKSLEMSEEFSSYNIDFLYDNGLIKEAVLEGKSHDEYWYNKTEYSRDKNQITRIDSSNISWGMTTNESSEYIYEDDQLKKVESESEFSSDSNNGKSSVIVELNYDENKKIKDLAWHFESDNYSSDANYSFEYDNGEISKVKLSKKDNDYETTENIRIDYELFEITKDDWEEWYKDYYYSCRYEVLHDAIRIPLSYNYSGLLEISEGYFDQYAEYYSLQYSSVGTEMWFGWVTLPKVIGRDYYNINE